MSDLVFVLARDYGQAVRWAASAKVPHTRWRRFTEASQIRGTHGARVVQLHGAVRTTDLEYALAARAAEVEHVTDARDVIAELVRHYGMSEHEVLRLPAHRYQLLVDELPPESYSGIRTASTATVNASTRNPVHRMRLTSLRCLTGLLSVGSTSANAARNTAGHSLPELSEPAHQRNASDLHVL